jgi:uncharacterized membrane protein
MNVSSRTIGRLALGGFLAFAGTGHLTFARRDFRAQVPNWVPLETDVVVLASGVVEIGMGAALIATPPSRRPLVGAIAAAFFVAVFPGNLAQYANHADAFGLNSDRTRAVRLLFQPVLVAWALWSTGAWSAWREQRRGG